MPEAQLWFRMYAEFAGDPVVQSLSFEDQRHYVVLLCLHAQGVFARRVKASIRQRIIAKGLGLSEAQTRNVIETLHETGLVTHVGESVTWGRRQYKSDSSSDRVRKHRRLLKDKETWNATCNGGGNGPETETETDIKKHTKNVSSLFKSFWDGYPRRQSKADAEKAFTNLTKTDQSSAVEGLSTFAFPDDQQFVPLPATWIRKRRWEDEQEQTINGEDRSWK